jgi:putative ATP-dependent endonuclease of OLD family
MMVQIRNVVIHNFRGISEASWSLPDSRFLCLVGPGDSTKTTLLDVIGLALSPRWNVTFTDADFHNGNTEEPIVLQVVVGDLPPRLLRDDAQGYELCGLLPNGDLIAEPEDGSESCVMIQLKVTDELEPVWTVVRPGHEDEGGTIGAGARAEFGLFRVDERVDAHLRWGRGSALTRITASRSGAEAAVTSAHRAARQAVFEVTEGALHTAAADVAAVAAEIGGTAFTELRPGLDPTGSSTTNALLLHDEEIPLTGFGLGSRRLVSLAIQEKAFTSGEIVLVDEVEHGLEPHRLLHLLHHLKKRTASDKGQVIMTTHSPLAVEGLDATDISVVRCDEGRTEVRAVPGGLNEMQGALRAGPSALLGNRVVVCEGKTEMGVVRRLLQHWDSERVATGKAPHAALGVCQTDGHGSVDAPRRALMLRKLGYPALLMIDNDDPGSNPGVQEATEAGAAVVRWQAGNAIEDEIASTLSVAGLADLVTLAAEIRDESSVLNAVSVRLSGQPTLVGLNPAAWEDEATSMAQIRVAIGAAAKGKKTNSDIKEEKKAWFKLEDLGERLGALVIDHWPDFAGRPLGNGLRQLYQFVYGEDMP